MRMAIFSNIWVSTAPFLRLSSDLAFNGGAQRLTLPRKVDTQPEADQPLNRWSHEQGEIGPCTTDISAPVQEGCSHSLKAGRTVTEVARDLGIARSLPKRWEEQMHGRGGPPGSGKPSLSDDSEEIRVLRQKLRDVTEERNLLMKALAYFADDQK